MYDTVIIGGGPAGLTAAIYLSRAGKKVLVLEKEAPGGQIASSPHLENYPGFTSISGPDFAFKLFEQATSFGAEFNLEEVNEIKVDDPFEVVTNYHNYQAKTIIIATGANYRKLNIPSEEKYMGKNIHFCVSCDAALYKDKDVAVIGGANSAVLTALYLSNIANSVKVVYRGDNLRGEDIFNKQLLSKKNVEVFYNAEVDKFDGKDNLDSVLLNTGIKLKVDGVFISIGMTPNYKLIKGMIDLTENNYILNKNMLTNIKGIFACGDIVDKKIKQITTAVSDGTIAAHHVLDYLDK